MENKNKVSYLLIGIFFYLIIPLLYVVLKNFPERTVLKNVISFLTLGSFFLMLSQFYLSRMNKVLKKGQKFSRVVKIHKAIGYIFIPVLFLHPFLLVVPRFFESGVDPIEAFNTILTNFGSSGIVLGLIAMGLMVLIGITSLLRNKIGLGYRTWRFIHGWLSMAFVVLATLHAIDLGRHTDLIMSVYMILMAATGIFFLLRLYIITPWKENRKTGDD